MALSRANRSETVQWERVAMQRFTLAETPTGVQVPLIRVPAGAIVTGGTVMIGTAYNDSGTDLIDIGDVADSDRYTATELNGATTTAQALTAVPYQYTAGSWITITYTGQNANASAGAGYLIVRYIVEGRFQEVEPEDVVPADDATPS